MEPADYLPGGRAVHVTEPKHTRGLAMRAQGRGRREVSTSERRRPRYWPVAPPAGTPRLGRLFHNLCSFGFVKRGKRKTKEINIERKREERGERERKRQMWKEERERDNSEVSMKLKSKSRCPPYPCDRSHRQKSIFLERNIRGLMSVGLESAIVGRTAGGRLYINGIVFFYMGNSFGYSKPDNGQPTMSASQRLKPYGILLIALCSLGCACAFIPYPDGVCSLCNLKLLFLPSYTALRTKITVLEDTRDVHGREFPQTQHPRILSIRPVHYLPSHDCCTEISYRHPSDKKVHP
ncbi:hypothetical protein EVAR_78406_1 [Eumeta japonica]|uniref:Uncharacterized protein n=1 Tax=Eumeta variegata TaxID=151549 RepID=A0A4C1T6H7_EUMVA|nr:hypothetical protein EVAR_78406_1 [Eumeta japonica]